MRECMILMLALFIGHAHAGEDSLALELLNRGIAAYQSARLEEARALFSQARDRVPDKANPHRWLALLDEKLSDCPGALMEADRFLTLVSPEDPRVPEIRALRDRCRPPALKLAPSPTVMMASPPPARPRPKRYWIAGVIGGAVAIGIAVGVGVALGERSTPETTLPAIHN